MSNQPASKIEHHWPITAAIWRNEGTGRVWYSVTIERTYKDKEGKLQQTSSFNAEDLLTVAKVADLAHTEIAHLRKTDRAAQVEPGADG